MEQEKNLENYNTVKQLQSDIESGKHINGYFHLAHYWNIRNKQIKRLNELSKTILKIKKTTVSVKLLRIQSL
jgi:hypothetical protein